MTNRDLIVDEVQKLAIVIAKLLGLKSGNQTDDYLRLIDDTSLNEYDIPFEKLLRLSLKEFETLLSDKNYGAVKLDYLAQLLYLNSEPFTLNAETFLSLQKTLIIFDLLEQKHHWQSFENINKRKLIYQYLNQS